MKQALIRLIRFYRRHLSYRKTPCCRFTPSCSQYAVEALEKYGVWKGGRMAILRLLRCHPFSGKSGYDPVE